MPEALSMNQVIHAAVRRDVARINTELRSREIAAAEELAIQREEA